MKIAFNTILGIIGAVLLLGVLGEDDPKKEESLTVAFAVVVLFTAALNTIM